MMNSEKATAARSERVKYSAASTRMPVQRTSMARIVGSALILASPLPRMTAGRALTRSRHLPHRPMWHRGALDESLDASRGPAQSVPCWTKVQYALGVEATTVREGGCWVR